MPSVSNTHKELGQKLLAWPEPKEAEFRRRVATAGDVLDIGGRNKHSISAKRLIDHGADPTRLVCTDILAKYAPDLVDDICNTQIAPESFDGIYCDAVLEHVTDYPAAITNIHKILRPGGQAFIYVPFIYPFHDEMDYHRFTITETARMLSDFSEVKVFAPDSGGIGWVLLMTATYGAIERVPRLHSRLAKMLNSVYTVAFMLAYYAGKRAGAENPLDLAYWAVHLNYNHGFFAWVRK